MTLATAQMASLDMSIMINAPAQKVWSALTADIGKWWPADFYTGGSADERNFMLEARPGGRMAEEWGDGGVLWGTVIGVEPRRRLQVSGLVFPAFGGPTQWYGTWTLTQKDDTTTLTFSEVGVGRVSASGTDEKTKGWSYLWNCMHAFIDGRDAPAWE